MAVCGTTLLISSTEPPRAASFKRVLRVIGLSPSASDISRTLLITDGSCAETEFDLEGVSNLFSSGRLPCGIKLSGALFSDDFDDVFLRREFKLFSSIGTPPGSAVEDSTSAFYKKQDIRTSGFENTWLRKAWG
jgi:hypothetical protein